MALNKKRLFAITDETLPYVETSHAAPHMIKDESNAELIDTTDDINANKNEQASIMSGAPSACRPSIEEAVGDANDIIYRAAKRAFDVASASALLVAISPLLLATAVAVKATSPGPVLFRQLRFGKDKKPFVCYKFRSMTVDAPDHVPTAVMLENPSAMTPIGSFLRKTSIDELPQLLNIIKGDMSVVGPRPMILAEREQVEARDAYGANDIRPGLTGWAQVNGRDGVCIADKAALDGDYRSHMSPAADAVCLAKSVGVVLSKKGNRAAEEASRADEGSLKLVRPMPENPDAAAAPNGLKILVVSQHYWPEPFFFPDVCEELVKRGNDVTVLTGIPNYPEGEVYDRYADGKRRYEERNGVRIIRSPLIPRHKDVIHRVANYFSFAAEARHMARGLERDFDVVVVFQTSPVMMAEPALEYGRLNDVPVLLWCMDIWPECLTAGGIKRGSAPFEVFRLISKRMYSRADKLAVSSPMFADYMQNEFGIDKARVSYLPQYAEDLFSTAEVGHDVGYDPAKVNLTFAGNVGSAQSVETIVEAANILRDNTQIVFHIVGSGSSEISCRERAKGYGLKNIVFHGRHELEEMPAYYSSSDAMLVSFANNPVLGFTLPRKTQSYLAAGKPIIGTGVGESKRVVDAARCGLTCDPDDPVGLAACCVVFSEQSRDVMRRLGANARAYYEANYAKELFFKRLESLFDGLIRE